MKEKVKEIVDYFKGKIIKGQYDVVKIDRFRMDIKIDNDFNFSLWVANGNSNLKTEGGNGSANFIELTFNETEKKRAFVKIKKIIYDNYQEKVFIEKRKQFEALKRELNIR